MIKVNAPAGYEGLRYYDDAVREWRVSLRRVGEKFWTNVGLAGHPHLTAQELDARSERIIADAIAVRRVA